MNLIHVSLRKYLSKSGSLFLDTHVSGWLTDTTSMLIHFIYKNINGQQRQQTPEST